MPDEKVDPSIVLPILKRIPLFSGLEEDLHREIIDQIVLMYYPEEYVIFKEGDEGDALYIIKKGSAEVFHEPKEEGDLPKKVAELGENDFFGEMALVSDVPRNASVKMLTDSEIFILSKDNFKKLLESNSVLAQHVSKAVVERLDENLKNQ